MPRQSILLLVDRPGWSERLIGWSDRFDVEVCAAAEEARVLLQGARPWAALLIDGTHPGADRDLIALARRSGTRPIVVDRRRASIDWPRLGAHAALSPEFTLDDLLAAIADTGASPRAEPDEGRSICVTGPGGTGASTVAIALAQGLAAQAQKVLLADFCRHAELHVLHRLEPDRPGIDDLVEAHRTASPEPATLLDVPAVMARGYRLLPGLRRALGWSSLRPRALDATLRNLLTVYDALVCDIDADLEGEAEGGSFDVEERNALSRTAVAWSAVAVAVGGPGAKGAHSLLRVLAELWAHGVAPQRTVAVVNRGDRQSVGRLGEALESLGAEATPRLFLPELGVEPLLLSDALLPEEMVAPLTSTVVPLLGQGVGGSRAPAPERVAPGSLGLAGGGPGAT